MNSFSSRYNHKPIIPLQIDNINEETKIAIWNYISVTIIRTRMGGFEKKDINEICHQIWTEKLAMPYDTYSEHYDFSNFHDKSAEKFTKVILKKPFYILFDCIESIIKYNVNLIEIRLEDLQFEKEDYEYEQQHNKYAFLFGRDKNYFINKKQSLLRDQSAIDCYIKELNKILEIHSVGYRIVDRIFSKLTNNDEISTLKVALDSPVTEANKHLSKAHTLLSNPRHCDYENSIKEAICAVETMARFVTGIDSNTLSDCIKKLHKNHPLHPALKESILKLYGYCSDCDGIRHGSKPGHNAYVPTIAEAKFILVMCSALNNYLLQLKEVKQ